MKVVIFLRIFFFNSIFCVRHSSESMGKHNRGGHMGWEFFFFGRKYYKFAIPRYVLLSSVTKRTMLELELGFCL